jgi:putative oxygen-independent coproporphyrinogen III oxidase
MAGSVTGDRPAQGNFFSAQSSLSAQNSFAGSAEGARPAHVLREPAPVHALYVHIPFCERKCSYCDFTSVGGVRGQRHYAHALRDELRRIGEALPGTTLDTVFIGGGTPSLLDTTLLSGILTEIHSSFTLSPGAEITMEANPSSTTAAKADTWLRAGINRISLGVQSLEPDVLAFLERVHGADRAVSAVRAVQHAGFTSINTDLIYAVPGLDDARWRRTLERILDLGCSHLSCYELIVEDGTPLATAVAQGTVHTADADTALRQHWAAVELAGQAGLRQYEISNFAVPGKECRHNLAYWHNDFYLAAGVGAHGHLPPVAARALGIGDGRSSHAVRYWHTDSIPDFLAASQRGLLPVSGAEAVSLDDNVAESILVGLRLTGEGVPLRDAGARREAEALDAAGLIDWNGSRAVVTARGQEVLDAVALRLVDSCDGRLHGYEITTPTRDAVKN